MSLALELRAAGLNVVEVAGWETRGTGWSGGKPVGVMHHHTANPVPFPVDNLSGKTDGKIKCNINTKQDGTLYLVAYKACNYSSGGGSSVVLSETKKGIAPPANAAARNLVDDTVGNAFYFNFENDHPGDGSPIPANQYQTILTATEVVQAHFGVKVGSVVSHAEWTKRKIDPYWNGSTRTVAKIRADLEDDAMSSPKNWDDEDIAKWRSILNNTLIEGTNSNLDFHLRNTYALAVQIKDMVSKLSAADLADLGALVDDISKDVNDEADKRARERLGTG